MYSCTVRQTSRKREQLRTLPPTFSFFDTELSCLINAYPSEWLVSEIKSDDLLKYDLADLVDKKRIFEPFWKLILGNKALLPMLWMMYPNH